MVGSTRIERGTFVVESQRGPFVESRHRIHAAVVDRTGAVQSWGDSTRPTIPRSAIKSIQALPVVATGAADGFGLGHRELGLACASHSGEPYQVEVVEAWLDRLGLDESDLECGPDQPLGASAKRAFIASGAEPRRVLNCCSGKHAGFLTVMCHLGHPVAGYVDPASPVQRLVTGAIEAFTGLDLEQGPVGVDGCGIPVYAVPLQRLALAMARLVDPVDVADDLAAATGPVVSAATDARWVAGPGRTEAVVNDAAVEPVVIKTGAEGVFMAALPERGLGIALKSEDGATRGSRTAIRALLQELGVVPRGEGHHPPFPVRNKESSVVGELRAVIGAPDEARLDRT